MFAVRDEPGLPAATQHDVVDRGLPAFVRHEGLGAQIGHRDDRLDRQPVIDGHSQHQRLGFDGLELDALADRGWPQHAEVQGAVSKRFALDRGEHVGPDLQRDAGQLGLDDAGDARQMREGGRAGEAEADQATAAGGDPACPADRVVDAGQDAGRLGLEEFAGGRQRDLPGGAVEERDVEFGFKLPNRIGQGWLGDVELIGGLAEVAGLGHFREIAKMT